MIINHHPSDMVLAEFAASTLDEAAALVVGAHVAQCPQCQQAVRRFETLGGALLDSSSSTPMMKADPLELLSQSELPNQITPVASPTAPIRPSRVFGDDARDSADETPEQVRKLLALYPAGKWRWAGPGVRWRPISAPSESGIRVFLLRAGAGVRLPDHSHEGIEWTCVLSGAFAHSQGRFGPGDFDEADDDVDHDPVVEPGRDCVCLVAMSGRLQLQGMVGRLLQPLVRF